jgi:hypothetical protein
MGSFVALTLAFAIALALAALIPVGHPAVACENATLRLRRRWCPQTLSSECSRSLADARSRRGEAPIRAHKKRLANNPPGSVGLR